MVIVEGASRKANPNARVLGTADAELVAELQRFGRDWLEHPADWQFWSRRDGVERRKRLGGRLGELVTAALKDAVLDPGLLAGVGARADVRVSRGSSSSKKGMAQFLEVKLSLGWPEIPAVAEGALPWTGIRLRFGETDVQNRTDIGSSLDERAIHGGLAWEILLPGEKHRASGFVNATSAEKAFAALDLLPADKKDLVQGRIPALNDTRLGVDCWIFWAKDISDNPEQWLYDLRRKLGDAVAVANHAYRTQRSAVEAYLTAVQKRKTSEIAREEGVVESRRVSSVSTDVTDVLRHLEEAKCVVLQGPPGTGKSWLAEQVVDFLAMGDREGCRYSALPSNSDRLAELPIVWDIVQMHPSYAYEDFIRGLRTKSGEGIHFEATDGVFVEMCKVARRRPGRPTLLILDEVNRCNLSSVLGEAILALEPSKRNKPVRLQLRGRDGDSSLVVPDNLWIIATMNTADRSIALVDYAIRRRFRFIDVHPSRSVVERFWPSNKGVHVVWDAIHSLVKETNLKVGHSYFIVDGDDGDRIERLARRLAYEVVPLLREYRAEGRVSAKVLEGAGLKVDLDEPQGGDKLVDGFSRALRADG
jgi:hypothetical protein